MNLTTDELVNGAGLRFCGHVEEDLERVECRHGAQRSLGIPQIRGHSLWSLQETKIPRQPRGPVMCQGALSSWTFSLSTHLPSRTLCVSA